MQGRTRGAQRPQLQFLDIRAAAPAYSARIRGGAMSIIEYVEAREILDSRGNPTVEVDVVL
ncbi:MAG TPA: hypothetical protein VFB30_17450, partial [Spirochaetia bacterium]|nr:hypothetical protein [Spirochaetia bacterium]